MIQVKIVTEDGSSTADINVNTDGDYVLPFSAERLEIFRSMMDGGMSMSQMMTY